jgi:hypothetical protein
MIYQAILHERNRRKALFYGDALNCVASVDNPTQVIKMCVDTDSNFNRLLARVKRDFLPYLSATEVVKIFDDAGVLHYVVTNAIKPLIVHVD